MDWNQLPNSVTHCCRTLWQAGFEAYPVGGGVRDLLLGRAPLDWDVCTSARPEEVSALFPRVVPTGLRHGTVTLPTEDGPIEVTTFRSDGTYSDGRHPNGVTFGGSLEDDLARRDFTVNAMALSRDGTVIDPFGGQHDLKDHLLRCVGDPDIRFQEDALRILRGIRFSAQLDFALETRTAAAMKTHAPLVDRISAERIMAELDKILISSHPERIGEIVQLGVLDRFGPAARNCDWASLSNVPREKNARWRAFHTLTGFPVDRLPISRSLRAAVYHPDREIVKTLALSGGALYGMGLRGQEIGQAQKRLALHVLDHPEDNTPERLTELLKGPPHKSK